MSDRLTSTNCCVFLVRRRTSGKMLASDALFSFSRRRKHLETVALRHNMRPWPLFFGNAGDKSLLEALIMKLNGIIHRRLLRSQAQYPLFSCGTEVRLANDLLLLNARGLLSGKHKVPKDGRNWSRA